MNSKLLFFLLISGILVLGCDSPDSKTSNRKAPPIVKKRVHWHTDINEAFEKSKKTGKPVFALFTGKDWCKPCQLLEVTILNTLEFAEWSNENVVLFEADFPKNRPVPTANKELQRKYRVTGYPTMYILTEDGTRILEPQYRPLPVEGWIKILDEKLKEVLGNIEKEKSNPSTETK